MIGKQFLFFFSKRRMKKGKKQRRRAREEQGRVRDGRKSQLFPTSHLDAPGGDNLYSLIY